jgi:hypothetical protein
MTPEERIEEAYLDAIAAVAEVIGLRDSDLGVMRDPGVDLTDIPATVVIAGHTAIKYLAVGAGILDGQGEDVHTAEDADRVLSMWTKDGGL